ncbi:hypothetical protein BDQ17DRAFT_1366255 [Cyathus striatus]|nr:hypothetical protein BDQ17DRAFT_1366255 [Cyathus striatus]
MDIDIDEFFSELDRRMSMPEEGSREYLQRLASYAKRGKLHPNLLPLRNIEKHFLQVDRGDHSDDSACIQPPNLVSKILPLSSSPLNRNTDSADCPQPDPSIMYNENSSLFLNAANASSYRFAATLRERGDLFSEQADVHDTIMNSSPEPVREFDSNNLKKVGHSYPQVKQADSRIRSPSLAPAETPEQLSP